MVRALSVIALEDFALDVSGNGARVVLALFVRRTWCVCCGSSSLECEFEEFSEGLVDDDRRIPGRILMAQ